jgi:copper chaperone NosL
MEQEVKRFFLLVSSNLDKSLNLKSRLLLVLAVIVLFPSFVFPLWSLKFWSYQYPDGLNLYIYSHKLVGGNDGNDLKEINILNHYIGMAEIEEEDFLELKWIPLAIGIFIVLALRAVIFGKVGRVLDVFMLFAYHNLNPRASVKVNPFNPPMFGFEQVGQFKVWSYPGAGSFLLIAFGLILLVSMVISIKSNETLLPVHEKGD